MLPGAISGGQGGVKFDGGAQDSESQGGNGSIVVGGFNVPTYPEAFGYPSAPATAGAGALLSVQTIALVALAGVGLWLITKKKSR